MDFFGDSIGINNMSAGIWKKERSHVTTELVGGLTRYDLDPMLRTKKVSSQLPKHN